MGIKKILKNGVLAYGFLFHKNRYSKVLFYHDAGVIYTDMGTPMDLIKKHIGVIKSCGFEIVENISKQENQIMLCFDDGWSGIYDEKDFFIKNKIFPTVFIAVCLIGAEGHLTIEQIKELAKLGFHFETHSWSHDNLAQYNDEDLHHELFDSKVEMERLLSMRFDAICYPQGLFSDKVIKMSNTVGYKRQFSSIWGAYYDKIETKGIICRDLVQNISPKVLKFVIEGASPYLTSRYLAQHYKK